MLQSCGTSIWRQAVSSKAAVSAPVGSPLRKRQSWSNEVVMRACVGEGALEFSLAPAVGINPKISVRIIPQLARLFSSRLRMLNILLVLVRGFSCEFVDRVFCSGGTTIHEITRNRTNRRV